MKRILQDITQRRFLEIERCLGGADARYLQMKAHDVHGIQGLLIAIIQKCIYKTIQILAVRQR